mmetsp:Transcript_70247/g.139145  ORF Transcript_70247/g.139145 Transcript_70247/m.139145 type:complete len:218 (+) Transcript_70247:1759-2412(+)
MRICGAVKRELPRIPSPRGHLEEAAWHCITAQHPVNRPPADSQQSTILGIALEHFRPQPSMRLANVCPSLTFGQHYQIWWTFEPKSVKLFHKIRITPECYGQERPSFTTRAAKFLENSYLAILWAIHMEVWHLKLQGPPCCSGAPKRCQASRVQTNNGYSNMRQKLDASPRKQRGCIHRNLYGNCGWLQRPCSGYLCFHFFQRCPEFKKAELHETLH